MADGEYLRVEPQPEDFKNLKKGKNFYLILTKIGETPRIFRMTSSEGNAVTDMLKGKPSTAEARLRRELEKFAKRAEETNTRFEIRLIQVGSWGERLRDFRFSVASLLDGSSHWPRIKREKQIELETRRRPREKTGKKYMVDKYGRVISRTDFDELLRDD